MINVVQGLNEKELMKSLFSSERKANLFFQASEKETKDLTQKWKNASLMTDIDSLFQEKLAALRMTEQEFASSIKKIEDLSLTEAQINELLSTVNANIDLNLFSEGLMLSEAKKNVEGPLDFSLFIRPFLSYIAKKLDKVLQEQIVNYNANVESIRQTLYRQSVLNC